MNYKRNLIAVIGFLFVCGDDHKFVSSVESPSNSTNNTKPESTGEKLEKDSPGISGEAADNEIILLRDLRPFDDQLAGHVFKGKLGVMVDSEGNLFKPYPTNNEIRFYKLLDEIPDHTIQEIKKFVPPSLGVKNVKDKDGKVIKFLKMENIMKDYKMVCTMDVKLGLVRIPPGAPPRSEEQELRYIETMRKWGFGIPGFKYYGQNGELYNKGKQYGYVMKPDQATEALFGFVQGEVGIKCGLVKTIVEQLKKIYSLYHKQRYFRCYDSSVLLTYDAKNIVDAYTKRNPLDEFDCDSIDMPIVKVRMLDFGKTVKTTKAESEEADENYLKGVRNLIYLLEEFLIRPPNVTANVEGTANV